MFLGKGSVMSVGMSTLLVCVAFLLCLPGVTQANWLYLGVASLGLSPQVPPQETCTGLPGLVLQQIEMCRNNPDAIWCVGQGVRQGIYECQNQFRFERWNCTTSSGQTVFGEVLQKGTREAAFIHAVTSAGVVHAVTLSCSAGNLTDCSCDMSKQGRVGGKTLDGDGTWEWGGCSDNIDYGIWFAETFVDAPEKLEFDVKKDIKSLVNLHNNAVGRETVSSKMQMKCRCHGVSGSCAVKSCWKSMANFRHIGKTLKERYEVPVEVAPRSVKKLRRREKLLRKIPVHSDELVYVDQSPNYCQTDPKNGVLGTSGRQCMKDSSGPDSCDLLCCGRGYNTHVERKVERCHCKFVWCCKVKCKICETMIDKHTCK